MSQYSEMMGSFIRTGNYPLEANYIFSSESALKEFYSDELNATTIHKGLLKIVEDDGTGNLGLYWVTLKLDTLEFTKLISASSIDSIIELINNLKTEIGDEITNNQELSEALEDLKTNYYDLLESTKFLAGTNLDNIVKYLKTLAYPSLTDISTVLDKFLNSLDEETSEINTLPELLLFLAGYTDKDTLSSILSDIQNEILGKPLPSSDFRTLRGIEDFVRLLKSTSENSDKNLLSELDLTQTGIGLSGDGSYSPDKTTYYLLDATSIMNALKVLDSLVHQAISGITIQSDNNDVVDLDVKKESDGYTIGAKLKISNVIGNNILKKDDGIYVNIKSTYDEGILSLYVNDNLISLHILGFSSIVESALYDSSQESIIVVFKLLNGEKQTITIPVGSLIREWDVDNTSGVVELTKNIVIDGLDKLSADVRISTAKNNILEKDGNSLLVDGTTDKIRFKGEILSGVIQTLLTTVSDTTDALLSEVNRATTTESDLLLKTNINTFSIQSLNEEIAKKAPIDSPILTGIPQVETSPDASDSSQRIPSTNWVWERIKEVMSTGLFITEVE